jgi:hypothetical protein
MFLSIFPSGFGGRVDIQTIQRGLGFSKKLKLGFKALWSSWKRKTCLIIEGRFP